MSEKLPLVTEMDGRISCPSVVCYEFTEGPHKGLRLNCPPSAEVETWIDPEHTKRDMTPGASARRPATYPYVQVVLDRETYDDPEFQAFLRSHIHVGGGVCIDNRNVKEPSP